MYIVNFGPDESHIELDSKFFKRKKDAVAFYNNLPNKTKQVKDTDGVFLMEVDGTRLCMHGIECVGQVFNGNTRKEVFTAVAEYLKEWDINFLDFEDFKYCNQITGKRWPDEASTAIILNNSLKKKYQASGERMTELLAKY